MAMEADARDNFSPGPNAKGAALAQISYNAAWH